MILSSSTQFELGCEMPKLNKGASAPLQKMALFLCPQYHSMVGVFWGALRSPLFFFVCGISTQLASAAQCLRSLAGGLLLKQRGHIMCNATHPLSVSEIKYLLAKQIPDMQRGFAIDTSYGSLELSPTVELEAEFKAVLDTVESYFQKQLKLEGAAS